MYSFPHIEDISSQCVEIMPLEGSNDLTLIQSQDDILHILEDLWAEVNIVSQSQEPFLDPVIQQTAFKPPSTFNPTHRHILLGSL